ncbi:MAG: hypothetical protein RBU29_16525 [bacterium]|jgi:hypothetical protein|nr:hypothetical protein [bacterium]
MKLSTTTRYPQSVVLGAALLSARTAFAAASVDEFIALVKSEKQEDKVKAWHMAAEQDATVVSPLASLLFSEDLPTAKCANECLIKLVHSVGQDTGNPKRKEITKALVALIDPAQPARSTEALRHLSCIADGDVVAQIAPCLADEILFEEAVYCLERIPGAEAEAALLDGLKKAPEAQQSRLLVALARRPSAATLEAVAPLTQSENKKVAVTAFETISRIGRTPTSEWRVPRCRPEEGPLYRTYMKSLVTLGDALIASGKGKETYRIFSRLLDREEIEEHYRCAAIVSLSKVDDAEAVKMIVGKLLFEPSYIVRFNAKNALLTMRGSSVASALQEAEAAATGDLKALLQEIITTRKQA